MFIIIIIISFCRALGKINQIPHVCLGPLLSPLQLKSPNFSALLLTLGWVALFNLHFLLGNNLLSEMKKEPAHSLSKEWNIFHAWATLHWLPYFLAQWYFCLLNNNEPAWDFDGELFLEVSVMKIQPFLTSFTIISISTISTVSISKELVVTSISVLRQQEGTCAREGA